VAGWRVIEPGESYGSRDYNIAWVDEEDGVGLVLGDDKSWTKKNPPSNRGLTEEEHKDAIEVYTMERALYEHFLDNLNDRGIFAWETKSAAAKALRVARDAVKNIKNPMPAWAVEARKHGWKPPKGWKP
jgi:hypothetical protein